MKNKADIKSNFNITYFEACEILKKTVREKINKLKRMLRGVKYNEKN
jgi:hypothetical protein